jgi:hypothetical protein
MKCYGPDFLEHPHTKARAKGARGIWGFQQEKKALSSILIRGGPSEVSLGVWGFTPGKEGPNEGIVIGSADRDSLEHPHMGARVKRARGVWGFPTGKKGPSEGILVQLVVDSLEHPHMGARTK